jgi:hypothetical protein
VSRLTPEREIELRGGGKLKQADADDLLGELDYLREQVEKETAYASELRRKLAAPQITPENYTPSAQEEDSLWTPSS